MEVTVVGCSGSFPGPGSPASCYLVRAAHADGASSNLLLDLGPGAIGPLQLLLDPRDIDAIFISHLHTDHMADLASLLVMLTYWPADDHRDRLPMPVYGPAGTAERIAHAAGSPVADVFRVFDVIELANRVPVPCGPLTITPFDVVHTVPAFGFRLTDDASTLAFSGDGDECAGLTTLADGADLLLIEAAFLDGRDTVRGVHLTGSRAGKVAATARARRTVLTHIPPWTPALQVLADARTATARSGTSVEIATPGATYPVRV